MEIPGLAAEGEVLVDSVAANVDGHPILYSDVKKKVDKGPLIILSEFPAKAEDPQFERALYDSINFQIVLNKAKEIDINVSDDDVEKAMEPFLEERHLTKKQLLAALAEEGNTLENFKEDFRNQMILRRFQGRVIIPLVKNSITDKDIETFYLTSSGSISNATELTLRQIWIEVPASATPEIKEQKEKSLKEIEQRLAGGMKFEDAVKIYSDDIAARQNGGLMEGIRAKDLSPNIKQAVENLKPGEFSRAVKFDNGYRIFEVADRKISGNQEFQEKKAQLQQQLERIEMGNQTNKWLAQQRQKTNIKIIKN